MAERIPLFPLGTVLFPGAQLPLHIFEPRYRDMVNDLVALPAHARREFGVLAIREGHEVGRHAVRALHPIGCTARLRLVKEHDDGRFDIVAQGADRFRLLALDDSRPYDQADIERITDEATVVVDERLVGRVMAAFADYRLALPGLPQRPGLDPGDPARLSFGVADAMVLDVADKQRLLAAADTTERLGDELALLHREIALIRGLRTVPAVELSRAPYGAN